MRLGVIRIDLQGTVVAFFRLIQLPKASEADKAARSQAIQDATLHAAKVPLSVVENVVELLPLIRLYSLFNVEPATTDPAEALLVIVEDDGRKCCVLVDDLLARLEEAIEAAPASFKLWGRDDKKSIIMGEGQDRVHVEPSNGPVFAQDLKGGKRKGTMEDLINSIVPLSSIA